MEGMKQYPDKYFDLAIVDPPYGIGIGKNGFIGGDAKGIKAREYKPTEWDNAIPNKEYFEELFRVSKHQIIWGGNYFTEHLKPSKSWVVWDKRVEEKYKNNFSDCELAWCNIGTVRIFRHLFMGICQKDMKNKEIRFHPTQKPIALYEWLLKNYAKQGDKILDTHVGSASSLIACYNLGFEYVGFELDKEYYDKAQKRLQARMAQMDIFNL